MVPGFRFPPVRSALLSVTVFLFSLAVPKSASARLADAIVNFQGLAGESLPAKLSETGLYADIALKTRAVTDGNRKISASANTGAEAPSLPAL